VTGPLPDRRGWYIKQYYGKDVQIGDRVRFEGREATVEDLTQYLHVRFDDHPEAIATLHPTYNVEYLSEVVE